MLRPIFKWSLAGAAIAALAGGCTQKTFHVETVIAAEPAEVWEVISEASSYPDWNPVFVEVVGDYALGREVLNRVLEPGGEILEITAEVTVLEPDRELRQKGGVPGVLTFDHRWLLEPVDDGTKVTQHEVDRGIGLWFWNSDWIEPAYANVNRALADRVKLLRGSEEQAQP
ncbi:MAG: SRPBCC domain-containing protein [Pseudomonadota bacterium]